MHAKSQCRTRNSHKYAIHFHGLAKSVLLTKFRNCFCFCFNSYWAWLTLITWLALLLCCWLPTRCGILFGCSLLTKCFSAAEATSLFVVSLCGKYIALPTVDLATWSRPRPILPNLFYLSHIAYYQPTVCDFVSDGK